MRGFSCGLVIGLIVGVVLAVNAPGTNTKHRKDQTARTVASSAQKSASVAWDLGSSFPRKIPFNGILGPAMVDRLKKISNSSIIIKFHEPKAL